MNGKIIDYQKARDLIKNGVHKKLNRRQAEMLFVENAVLIGQKDGVTEETVKSLFGDRAVKHVRDLDKDRRFCNGYGIGDYTQQYFTYDGFLMACTFNNVLILESERG